MPFIQIKISGAGNSALAENVARRVVVLTHRHLHKDPALTAVAVEFVPAEQWFVAGKSLQAQKTRSFYLQISITDETNTKDEKAAYLAAVFALMNELLGGVHEKSYVHVVDARGAAYGYGGHAGTTLRACHGVGRRTPGACTGYCVGTYSGVIPPSLMTRAHFATSLRMIALTASGVPPSGSIPCADSLSLTSPICSTTFVSRFSEVTMSFEVPAGASSA